MTNVRFLIDWRAWAALAGPALAAVVYAALPDVSEHAAGLTPAGRATTAVAAWMAVWWITEAVPLAVTSLLPIVLFPLLGVASGAQAATAYAHPLVFLFMGGFIIGLALQKCGLHRRLALTVLLAVGAQPSRLVAGFMLATAAISMWISNTATAMMMLPIGKSVLDTVRERLGSAADERFKNFGSALMLGIAYAASIGGLATLVGTPPNMIFAGFVEKQYGVQITMAQWMTLGIPLTLVLLPLCWWLLVRLACPVRDLTLPAGRDLIRSELDKLGAMSRAEWIVMVVFIATVSLWLLQARLVEWTGIQELSDATIAMSAALLLFVLPTGEHARARAMDWQTAKTLPWDILILFGGGLSLAAALSAHHVDAFLASGLSGLSELHVLVFLFVLALSITALSEVASNTAIATALMPVLAAAAVPLGLDPALLLVVAALAASCGFMLPVATPPNAIVYGSGYVPLGDMLRAGLALDVIGAMVIALFVYFGGHPTF